MILHVACLPFPSYQGTQAALDAMLRASVGSKRSAELLVYSHGAYAPHAPYRIHRISDFPKVRSLRSGPSLGKLLLDARCITETRRLWRRLRPNAVVAHHVEAALAALAAGARPLYYVAHTSLTRELPVYVPMLPASMVSRVAARAEAFICRHVDGVAAVAPALARLLGGDARYLPVPWPSPPKAHPPSRGQARRALQLPGDAPIFLYAGNLDPYQGWDHLLGALAVLRATKPRASLLLATESDPGPALREARRLGVEPSVHFRRLDGERARSLAHAASDLAWIPRRTEGGLPIKMLDAFARGLPVIAMERATAGLRTQGASVIVANDDPHALAAAAARLIDDAPARDALRKRGLDYLSAHHCTAAFDGAMQTLLSAEPTSLPTPSGPPRAAVAAPRAR
jgi:glycosyltransferase involved in cell wall biosynthesis